MKQAVHPTAGAIAARVFAAMIGGYALTWALTGALAVLLPLHRADAVIYPGMLAFPVYTAAILWCVAARSALRAWLVLGVPTVLLTAVIGVAR